MEKRSRLQPKETEALIEAAVEIMKVNPDISPMDLFVEAQVKALPPDRRYDIVDLQSAQYNYWWLSRKAKNRVAGPSKGSNPQLSDQGVIKEFADCMNHSREWEVQIEDRLQAIESFLETLVGVMKKTVDQKKTSGT